MIIDAFNFFDELDLLEIRLNILNDHVDYFVILEATETFSGVQKPLYFMENISRFSKWRHKIIHFIVDDFPDDNLIYKFALNSINTGNEKNHWWVREFYQKESLIKALVEFDDNDVVFVSDLDEIWNPQIKIKVFDGEVYRPIQTAYHYYLNNRTNQDIKYWTGTRFCNLRTLRKYGPNHVRTEFYAQSIKVNNGGWHFTFLGGAEKKINGYSHPEYKKNKIRKFESWIDESGLPDYLIQNKSQWRHYFLDDSFRQQKSLLSRLSFFKKNN